MASGGWRGQRTCDSHVLPRCDVGAGAQRRRRHESLQLTHLRSHRQQLTSEIQRHVQPKNVEEMAMQHVSYRGRLLLLRCSGRSGSGATLELTGEEQLAEILLRELGDVAAVVGDLRAHEVGLERLLGALVPVWPRRLEEGEGVVLLWQRLQTGGDSLLVFPAAAADPFLALASHAHRAALDERGVVLRR